MCDATGLGWAGELLRPRNDTAARGTSALRFRQAVLNAGTPSGENVAGLGADIASFTLHMCTLSLLLRHAPSPILAVCSCLSTGGRCTVCAGRCVHRAGQRLQRHDLLLPAGLLLPRSSIGKAFANPHSLTRTHARARAHTPQRARSTRRHASIPPALTPHA